MRKKKTKPEKAERKPKISPRPRARARVGSEPAKRGQPRAITPELREELQNLLGEGMTATKACAQVGVAYRTFNQTQVLDPQFHQAVVRARIAGAWARVDSAADRLNSATNETIAAARESAIHDRWVASKMVPERFGERVSLQADVAVTQVQDRDTLLLETARTIAYTLKRADEIRRERGEPLALPASDRAGDNALAVASAGFTSYTRQDAPPEPAGEHVINPEVDDQARELDRAERIAEAEVSMQLRAQRRPSQFAVGRQPFTARRRR